ncbi:hypothetical protein LOZ66_004536 [Ophidiomyces ophidiicola]|nr:hypothetical protein LOZ66_004536 [Ophidiomyces ophidiicola]
MFILVGSQALRVVQIKNDHGNYVRSTEAKIRLLREVIERLQRGEDVDVRKLLGTGDEIAEREWEEAIREISQEEPISQPNTQPLPKPGTEPTTQNDKGADTTHPPKQARDTNQNELKKRTAKFY